MVVKDVTLIAAFATAFRQDDLVPIQTGRTSLATRSGRFPVVRIYGGTFECIHKSHALLTLLPYISETFQTGT